MEGAAMKTTDDSFAQPAGDERLARGHAASLVEQTRTSRARWLLLWLMTSIGVGVGVVGTAVYVAWFGHDLLAYENAIRSARERLTLVDDTAVPLSMPALDSVQRTAPVTPIFVTRGADALTFPPAQPLFNVSQNTAEPAHDTCAATANLPPANNPITPVATSATLRQRPVVQSRPPTLFSRLGSAFHRVNYRHHGTGFDQTPYSHP
jgi:hypothetical protein